MRILTLTCMLIIACTSSSSSSSSSPSSPSPVAPAKVGQAFAFGPAEAYRGKILVLDFWASWCEACKRGVPRFNRLAAAFPDGQVAVLGINVGEPAARAAAGAKALGITYPFSLDTDLQLSDSVGASELPFVVVIDRTGHIVHRSRELDDATLQLIRELAVQ